MATESAHKLVLIGEDRSASKAFRGVERSAKGTEKSAKGFGTTGKLAMAGIAGAVVSLADDFVRMGTDAVGAFADAEKSQAQLADAWARFPKVQNVSLEALQRYNQELQRKTGADADELAASQAVLARYKMTGKQLQEMTPLLIDYANRTGKELPAAAGVLGKAFMGSARATKELGVNVKLGKDPAENYQKIMAALSDTVGGYTEKLPEAEKKQKILAASVGDLQESFGEKLQPAMIGLVDTGQGMLDWLEQNPEVMEGAAAAADLVGEAFKGIWWVISKLIAPAFGWFLKGQVAIVRGAGDMVDALNQVPGLGDIIPDDAGDKLREVAGGLDSVANGLQAMAKEPVAEVKVDPTPIERLDKRIRSLKGKVVEARAKGDDREVDRLKSKLDKLRNKRIGVEARVYKTGIRSIAIRGVGGGTMRISAYAGGSSSVPFDQFAVVGEAGPEVVRLPARSQVLSNGQSRAAANQGRLGGGAAGGGTTVQFNLVGLPAGPRAFAEAIERELYGLMKSRGPGGTLSFLRKR